MAITTLSKHARTGCFIVGFAALLTACGGGGGGSDGAVGGVSPSSAITSSVSSVSSIGVSSSSALASSVSSVSSSGISSSSSAASSANIAARNVTTYFTLDIDKSNIPNGFFGFSLYTAMWPMVKQSYSGLQAGLVGTWLNPHNLNFDQALVPEDHPFRYSAPFMAPYYRGYQTIEGSGGYWNNTHFHSTQPKYRINGTPNGYSDQLSAPGWEFGQNAIPAGGGGAWGLPMGSAGVAQLSNRLLVPPDGLTFSSGTNGELFGAAWMALPLTSSTTGSNPIGDLSWTFFINATNVQGPVLFYLPDVWEALATRYPTASGRGLDARPAVFAGGLAMEMSIPLLLTADASGTAYGRLAGLSFPADASGTTYLSSDLTVYTEAALFTPVMNWLKGGSAISGQFSLTAAITPDISAQTIYMWSGAQGTADFKQMQSDKGLANYVKPTVVTTAGGGSAWALKWQDGVAAGAYPEYFKSSGDYMVPIPAGDVPEATGLTTASFQVPDAGRASYISPTSWNTPAPAKGPFKATLVDGSVVTYYWYKFIDQPSMQGFGWTTEQKNALQAVVEKIHQNWGQ